MSSTTALIRTNSESRTLAAPHSLPQAFSPQREGRQHTKDIEGNDDCSSAPEPQPPVPFILLLLLVGAGALVMLPFIGACNFENHRILLFLGAVLILPFMAFEAALHCGGRAWVLGRFFVGDYSEGAKSRQLPCLWYPERVQMLQYTTGEVAGNNIETYATWETTAIVEYVENVRGGNRDGGEVVRDGADLELHPGSNVRIHGLQNAADLNGMRGTCQEQLAHQNRWRVKLQNGVEKNVKPENLQDLDGGRNGFKITIPASFGTDVKVTMDSTGELNGNGLPFKAEFDGSAIVAKSGHREGQAWRKAGYWRLDFVTKVLIAMAILGLESMFVATILPPGVISEESDRLPLKAVYLVDGSTSITPLQWKAALEANKKFVTDFADVYGSDQGKLNFGFVQFSSEAHVELPITHEMSRVTTMLNSMQQRGGMTNFNSALSLCQQLLNDYTAAGPKTFDVCVLITDGKDGSFQSADMIKSLVAKDTAVFGIFVGNDPVGSAQLHRIVGCGKAESKSKQGCDFFASAMDFQGLAQKTREIAEDVTHGSDMALCAEQSAVIEGPFLICLILPYILWYLSCCTVTIAKRRLENYRKNGSYDLLMLNDRA